MRRVHCEKSDVFVAVFHTFVDWHLSESVARHSSSARNAIFDLLWLGQEVVLLERSYLGRRRRVEVQLQTKGVHSVRNVLSNCTESVQNYMYICVLVDRTS